MTNWHEDFEDGDPELQEGYEEYAARAAFEEYFRHGVDRQEEQEEQEYEPNVIYAAGCCPQCFSNDVASEDEPVNGTIVVTCGNCNHQWNEPCDGVL